VLTTVLLLCSAQLVEVPLHQFQKFAEPRGIAAVALSPNAHTVSVWTRWSEQTPCVRWTIDVQTGKTEGFGEDDCPASAPLPPLRSFGEEALQGKPTPSQLTVHPVEPVIALRFEHALTFISRADGKLISSFRHGGYSVKGVAASEGEWLLWVQSADGAEHLYLADAAELTSRRAQKPFVSSVPWLRLPDSFGWKKDTKGTPGSVCDFFERPVMIAADVLLLDWNAASKPIDLRVRAQDGRLQKWQIDIGSATPVAGLQVERMQLAKQGRVRLKVRLPFGIDALAVVPSGAKVARLSPIEAPLSTGSTEPACIFVDGALKPERFMLDAWLR
jgi:hypothetical protein